MLNGLAVAAVFPSPKFHAQPVASLELSVKLTISPLLDEVKAAMVGVQVEAATSTGSQIVSALQALATTKQVMYVLSAPYV